uniref:Uncharacterized protein n=1 Tax=Arundo donax TaxID=35708 RepID=A0A0A9E777_ARUDO
MGSCFINWLKSEGLERVLSLFLFMSSTAWEFIVLNRSSKSRDIS